MPDNLNTVYLGTPGATGDALQGSSETAVMSDLSISGTLDVGVVDCSGAATITGALTGSTGAFTSTLSADGAVTAQSTLSVAGQTRTSAVSTAAFTASTAEATSTLSVRGVTTLHAALNSASAISGGALSATSGMFTDRLSIGSTFASVNPACTLLSGSSTTIVATTVNGQESATTTWTDNRVLAGDIVWVGPSSTLSTGVVLQAVASANSTITFVYSNVSTVNAAQVAINANYAVIRMFS